MRTQVIVHSAEDYAAWVESRIAQEFAGNETVAHLAPGSARTQDYLAAFTEDLSIGPDQIAQLVEHPMH